MRGAAEVKRYRLAAFDFDGTLADSFPWFLANLNRLAEKHGFRAVQPEEIPALRAMCNRALMRHLAVPGWRLPWIAYDMRRMVAKDIGGFRLHPGIAEMICALEAKGVKLAIVTSNSERNVKAILGAELAGKIHAYQCGASLFGKARSLKKALRKSGARPESSIYFGDETRDLEAATLAGMDFGFVEWGYATRDAFRDKKPALVLSSPAGILALLYGKE